MFRSAPISTFYPLDFVFSDKYEISTKYGMSNSKTGQKRFGLYPDRFRISRIYRDIPFLLIWYIPFYYYMCGYGYEFV
jgi:hypothetical protein